MKNTIIVLFIILLTAFPAAAQKTNDTISKQIKSLKADKNITLEYDAASNTTKIFVRADNFSDAEAKRTGIQAMNFGMAHIYVGKTLDATPEAFDFAFWVLSKKPRFTDAHTFTVTLGKDTLDLGDARYGPKPRENMEYLNFRISRDDLAKIAAGSNVKFHLGAFEFTFTPAQLTIFKNLLAVSDNR